MTKLALREAIKRESRINRNNLDTLVDDIVADIITDYCNKSRYFETLLTNVALTLVAAQQAYALPADYMNLVSARYGRGPSPTAFRELDPQPETVRQSYNAGYPKYYRLVAGPAISLWPYGQVVIQDQLMIDYYFNPSSVFVEDSDPFPIPRLESAVKKDAIARVQRFHSSTQEGQMTEVDAHGSFIAGESASK